MEQQTYLMFRQFMISRFSPLSNSWSMKYNNSEIRVKKKDFISSNGNHIEKYRFWPRVEWVGDQGRLNHDNWIRNIFSIQNHPKIRCLIWAIIEDLNREDKTNPDLSSTKSTVHKVLEVMSWRKTILCCLSLFYNFSLRRRHTIYFKTWSRFLEVST